MSPYKRPVAILMVGAFAAFVLASCAPVQPANTVHATPVDRAAFVYFGTHADNDLYQVEVIPGNAKYFMDSESEMVTGLTNGTAYTFRVRARGTNGNWSGWTDESAPVIPRTVPDAPTIDSVTRIVSLAECEAVVNFAAPASDGGSPVTGYLVTAPGVSATPIPAGTSSPAHVTGMARGTSSTFTIRAVNAAGTGGVSNEVTRDCPA